MIFVDYNPNDLELTAFGIWEPRSGQVVEKTHIDLIHVPVLLLIKVATGLAMVEVIMTATC